MTTTHSTLVVAAHPDDEVLGCGGTIAKLAASGHAVHVLLLADGESSRSGVSAEASSQRTQTRHAAALAAGRILGCASVRVEALPDNRLDSMDLLDIVKLVESAIEATVPATVFTHHSGDVNVDHRMAHEAVLAACRPQPGHPVRELYFFEVPSSTEWRPPGSAQVFAPNRFMDISQTLSVKLRALEAYAAELRLFPHPRSVEAVTALARWRGASVGVEAAEAFMVGRQII
jgi:LmbE family N-acetylglucosaminyl deacetylase